MFSWEGQDVATACATVAGRDPRRYRIAMVTEAPWPEGSACSLYWFARPQELAQFLMRVEPRRRGVEMGELIAFKARVQDVITAVEVTGINEQLRTAFNGLSAPVFGVRWWGMLEAIKAGQGEWPQTVLRRFGNLPADAEQGSLDNRQVPELIRFLQQHYPPA